MNWLKGLNADIIQNEPLAKHTTLKVGPVVDFWVVPKDVKALKILLKRAKGLKKDYCVIGNGSNLLILKKRLALAIHLGAPAFSGCEVNGQELIAGCGIALPKLLKAALNAGLGGLEFLTGIPASLGGLIMLNAGVGWPERIEIGPFVESLEVMDRAGQVRVLGKERLTFGYRYSNLMPYIILRARLGLFKKRKNNITIKMGKFMDYRKRTQEMGFPSAGCIFKNPPGDSSGRLIELCGLKGRRVGDAFVSKKHANFIVNLGRAAASDIAGLMRLAGDEVYNKFKIRLKPEIRIIR